MTSHEQYIKQAFKRYTENKKRLRELSFDGVRGVDYSKVRTSKATPQGNENALVRYLDEKRTIEKQTELVERTLEYYDIRQRAFGEKKVDSIRCRFVKGMSFTRAGIELGLSQLTACCWVKDIYDTAAAIAILYNYF